MNNPGASFTAVAEQAIAFAPPAAVDGGADIAEQLERRRQAAAVEQSSPDFGVTLHVHAAARALLPALTRPSGIYNVCRDSERVFDARFTGAAGWHPTPAR